MPTNSDIRTALMFAHSFPPISTAGVFRILRFVKYLPEFGWETAVVAAPSRHGMVLKDDALLRQVPATTTVERPAILNPESWIGNLLPRRNGKSGPNGHAVRNGAVPETSALKAAAITGSATTWRNWVNSLRELVFRTPDEYIWWVGPAVRAGMRAVNRRNPEVIYTTGPPHSTHLAGLIVHQLTGLPWVADFRDPWSRQPWGQKRNLWGARLLPSIESECVRHASRVILNTGRMALDFQKHYHAIRSSRFVAIPNGFDPDLKETVAACLAGSSAAAGGTTAGSARLLLCHPGSLYHKRDLRPFVDAVGLLRAAGRDVRFENIGECPGKAELEAYVRDAGLQDAFVFEDPIPHRSVLERMARSDVLVVIQPANDLQVPGKLYEMMLFGKPILALVDEGEVSDLVRRYRLGQVAAAKDPGEIARVIQALDEAPRSGHAHPEAIAAFDGRALTARLAECFDAAVREFGLGERPSQLKAEACPT